MAKLKGHARRFAEWEEKPAKDFDPEAEPSGDGEGESGSDSDTSRRDHEATKHYVEVEQGKLLRNEAVQLGPKYRGTRVSRADLEAQSEEDDKSSGEEDDDDGEEDDYDDPETADPEADAERYGLDDEELDSDEAFGESDEEKFEKFSFPGSSKPKKPVNGSNKGTRPTAADFIPGDEESEEEEDDDEGLDKKGPPSTVRGAAALVDSDSSDSEGESGGETDSSSSDGDDAAAASKMRAALEQTVVSGMSASASSDVAKGVAVRRQRRAFDALLGVRIRLQRALVAANSLAGAETAGGGGEQGEGGETDEAAAEPYAAAEAAALELWDALSRFRAGAADADGAAAPSKKRKLSPLAVTPTTTTAELWRATAELDAHAAPTRRRVIDGWASRLGAAAVASAGSAGKKERRLGGGAKKGVDGGSMRPSSSSLVDALEDQMDGDDAARLVRRTRVPRSCAPLQAAQTAEKAKEKRGARGAAGGKRPREEGGGGGDGDADEAKDGEGDADVVDVHVFDDADFYQLLLKELVEQHGAAWRGGAGGEDGDAATATTAGRTVARWAPLREAKTKKVVDTRASKGRKMRFTVHERLQNFMAPEDRRAWEDDAIDRLFATLFGRRLEEDRDPRGGGQGGRIHVDADDGSGSVGIVGEEEMGLRLFRS